MMKVRKDLFRKTALSVVKKWIYFMLQELELLICVSNVFAI